MYRPSLLFTLLLSLLLSPAVLTPAAQAQERRDILTGRYGFEEVRAGILPVTEWYPFPKAGDAAG